jgi:predicted transglutaminase-like cysteine proteinase
VFDKLKKNFLRGRFMLAAAVTAMIASSIALDLGETAEKDKNRALFPDKNDAARLHFIFPNYDNRYTWLSRHQTMMQDPANAAEFKSWLSKLDSALDKTPMEKIDAVKKLVSNSITYTYEQRLYDRGEYLAAPLQTIRARQGDCDDFAILYYYALRYLGFPEEKCGMMLIASGSERVNHMIAFADTSAAEQKTFLSKNIFILDNNFPGKHLENTDYQPRLLINRLGLHDVKYDNGLSP